MVGRASFTIDVDSKIQHVRDNSEARLVQELKYASHLGLPAVMVTLQGRNHTNLARILSNYLVKGASFQVWVQVPVCSADLNKYEDSERAVEQTWDWWNTFRLVTDSSSKVNLCLDLTEQLPENIHVERWLGEPVKTVSSRCFDNDDNLNYLAVYPYLPLPHQQERLPRVEQAAPELCQAVHQPGHSGELNITLTANLPHHIDQCRSSSEAQTEVTT